MDNEPHAVIYIELFMNPKPLWLWDFFNMENVPVMFFPKRFYKSFSKGLVSLQKQTLGHIKALISKEVYVMKSKWSIQKLIYTGMLAAMAGALMSLEFSVPMMPPFYKVDFSDVPSIMALFLFGPASAAWVEIIKILIKLITVGTNSMYVGELSNLIGVALFVIPLWIVYNKMGKNRRAAITGLSVSIAVRTAFACFCNAFITLPLYAKAMGVSLDSVVTMVASVNPAITSLTTFIVMATIPFNILKLGLNYFVGYLLFNRLTAAYPSLKPARQH